MQRLHLRRQCQLDRVGVHHAGDSERPHIARAELVVEVAQLQFFSGEQNLITPCQRELTAMAICVALLMFLSLSELTARMVERFPHASCAVSGSRHTRHQPI
jgi:hypothetical protein